MKKYHGVASIYFLLICFYTNAHIAFTNNDKNKLLIVDITFNKSYIFDPGELKILETANNQSSHFLLFEHTEDELTNQPPLVAFATPETLPKSSLAYMNTQNTLALKLPEDFYQIRSFIHSRDALARCQPKTGCSRCAERRKKAAQKANNV